MIFGVITAVFVPLIAESGSQIFSKTSSVKESIEAANMQSGQILTATHSCNYNGLHVFVSNIGIVDITIRHVLIDGHGADYTLQDQDMNIVGMLRSGELGILNVTGNGERVQIVTNSGKVFDFHIG